MAVSPMRKVQILAHNSAKDEIIAALREGGVIHITEPALEIPEGVDEAALRERERQLQARVSKLVHIKDFLRPYVPKQRPSLEAMLNPRMLVEPDEIDSALEGFDLDEWYDRVIHLDGDLRSGEAEIARKEALADEIDSWRGLDAPFETLGGTRLTSTALVSVEASALDDMTRELLAAAPEVDVFLVSRIGSSAYVAVLYLRALERDVTAVLKRFGARTANVAGEKGLPEEAAERLRSTADELRARNEELRGEAVELARERGTVLIVLDEASEQLAKTTIQEKFAHTRDTFLVEGWIRAEDEDAVRRGLHDITYEIEMSSRLPERGEDVPIALDNGPVVHPFEFVTTLYGRPVYQEKDPTPLLAPFFILFFGLCISDAGYGVTLAALSFVFMRKMQPGGGRQLMKLLMMGGISTAAVGTLMGGWFGIHHSLLPAWLHDLIVLNPLDEPMKMLNIVFILGIVQIITGLVIKMIEDIKQHHWADALLDELVWVFFLIFLAPLGYGFILGGKVPADALAVSQKGAMAAGAIVVVTGARKNKNPILKVLGGVLKLYDVVGYFGDVLSYARLLALGLATGAIAMAINGVAEMAGGMPIIGPVAFVIVLIGGHFFNIAVNCLGGFVHSARLQYLEFFSKFFTGGGRAFAPFRVEKRYSMVRK